MFLSRAYQKTIAILLLSEFFGKKKLFFFSHLQYNIAKYCNTSEKKNARNNELKTTIKTIFVNTFFHGINVPKFMIVMKKKLQFQISRQHTFPMQETMN